ncbi:MarR family transcriptional regulator [Paenibacillus lautus]|uniref:MarR family transcriptional regulator n=1 Tax=Paenibacillus lautus TaxID=1401 RepID=UPI001FD30608|nr:MarR family transcriptional regulator [Paenibacillus lautus]
MLGDKALSEKLLIDKTTTAKAIAKLEAEDYVRRETNPADNRYHLLYLTESDVMWYLRCRKRLPVLITKPAKVFPMRSMTR